MDRPEIDQLDLHIISNKRMNNIVKVDVEQSTGDASRWNINITTHKHKQAEILPSHCSFYEAVELCIIGCI